MGTRNVQQGCGGTKTGLPRPLSPDDNSNLAQNTRGCLWTRQADQDGVRLSEDPLLGGRLPPTLPAPSGGWLSSGPVGKRGQQIPQEKPCFQPEDQAKVCRVPRNVGNPLLPAPAQPCPQAACHRAAPCSHSRVGVQNPREHLYLWLMEAGEKAANAPGLRGTCYLLSFRSLLGSKGSSRELTAWQDRGCDSENSRFWPGRCGRPWGWRLVGNSKEGCWRRGSAGSVHPTRSGVGPDAQKAQRACDAGAHSDPEWCLLPRAKALDTRWPRNQRPPRQAGVSVRARRADALL